MAFIQNNQQTICFGTYIQRTHKENTLFLLLILSKVKCTDFKNNFKENCEFSVNLNKTICTFNTFFH